MILINEQQIRARIPASANVEMSLLRPNIQLYQETRLAEILGWNFYQDIITKYSNQTLNTAEQTLLTTMIHPLISFGGLKITIPFLWGQISNRGVIQQSGDFTAPATDAAFRAMRDSVNSAVNHYEERLIKYLELNKSSFTLWVSSTNNLQNPETQSPNDFGFILDFFDNVSGEPCQSGPSCGGGGSTTEVKPYANMWDYTPGEITSVTASNTWYKLNTNMTSPYGVGFSFSNESLTYTNTESKVIELSGIASLVCGNNNDISAAFFINGQLYPCSQQDATAQNNKPAVIPFHCVATLNQGDVIEVYVKNITSTTDITLYHVNIIVKQIV